MNRQTEPPKIPLFVWRSRADGGKAQGQRTSAAACSYCGAAYNVCRERDFSEQTRATCPRCGYWFHEGMVVANPGCAFVVSVARLRTLDINDAGVGLDELGAHLRRSFGDVYAR